MNFCFIDNDVSRWTLDVIRTLKSWSENEHIDSICEFELLWVDLNHKKSSNETFKYFTPLYEENKIKLTKIQTIEELKQVIGKRKNQDICFMVDLNLNTKEKLEKDIKCTSMEIMDWLEDEKYCLYSDIYEKQFQNEWIGCFKSLYPNQEIDIKCREDYSCGSFMEEKAEELFKGFGINMFDEA
jgi:hypothetical protein